MHQLTFPSEPMSWDKALCSDPYRLFFPLGVVIGCVGVGQWLLFALGFDPAFRSIFHSMAQVQGFLGAFIAGFLFTFIPRRTMTSSPAMWQLVVAALCPVLLCLFAWYERWAIAQLFWLIELGVLLQFVASRAMAMKKPQTTPASLIWIPLGLSFGLAGAVITAWPGLHDLGRGLLLEGMASALVMGIGAMLVPVITRSEAPKPPAQGAVAWQVVLAVVFTASFVLQAQFVSSARIAYGLRLAVALSVLGAGARLWRWPTQPGLNRRVVWFSAWCLPLGLAALTVWPSQRSAGLHVIFLAGFGLLAMSIGQHVVASHRGRADWLAAWPLPTAVMSLCLSLALVARVLMQLNPNNYRRWLAIAAFAFVTAGASWLSGMAPMLVRQRSNVAAANAHR